MNTRRLAELTSPVVTIKCADGIDCRESETRGILENYLRDCQATAVLQLKTDAQVMLLRNLTGTLVNGSRYFRNTFAKTILTNRDLEEWLLAGQL